MLPDGTSKDVPVHDLYGVPDREDGDVVLCGLASIVSHSDFEKDPFVMDALEVMGVIYRQYVRNEALLMCLEKEHPDVYRSVTEHVDGIRDKNLEDFI